MAFRHFSTLNEFLDSDIIQKEGFKLVGVEIGENALDVNTHPFFEKSIIVMGNEVSQSYIQTQLASEY